MYSIKIIELVLELEQRFGVSLPFEELEIEDFRTVAKLAERSTRTAAVAALGARQGDRDPGAPPPKPRTGPCGADIPRPK